MQVVGAIVVVFAAAQRRIAMDIAGRDDRVMASGRGVLLQDQDRPPPVRRKAIARGGENALQTGVQVFHRHELGQIIGIEAPGVDDLLTMGVDDLDRLSFAQTNRAAAPCRYNLKICRHIAIPLPLAHWRICLVGISVVGQCAKGQAASKP